MLQGGTALSDSENSEIREVNIVKRKTTMSSDEYFQINLKSPDESVDSLLEKAITVMEIQSEKKLPTSFELMS